MKGMVFTQFLEMVEQRYSMDMVDTIIENSRVASGGVYTAVGTYPHEEMVALVGALSAETGITVPDLLMTYGEQLFSVLVKAFPHFLEGKANAFDFLSVLDNYIHVEVRKLYPDAELPRFVIDRPDDHHLCMTYISTRHMKDLAVGLLTGCLKHFGENVVIDQHHLENGDTRFVLTRQA
jgi:Haem-NO-binding